MPEYAERLRVLNEAVVACTRCPRLTSWCARVAEEKRAAYADETYWGRPVPSFGDPRASVLIVGLAPGAQLAFRSLASLWIAQGQRFARSQRRRCLPPNPVRLPALLTTFAAY